MPPVQIIYLILTIAVEYPVHRVWLRQHRWWTVLIACVLLNGFTHPLANYAILELRWNYFLVEALVTLSEALILALGWRIPLGSALLLSLLANALSVGVGWLFALLTVWLPTP